MVHPIDMHLPCRVKDTPERAVPNFHLHTFTAQRFGLQAQCGPWMDEGGGFGRPNAEVQGAG